MDSNDTTERALAERVQLRTQQLAEAQAALDQYRVDREAERQIELDREVALTLQEEERRQRDQRRNEAVLGLARGGLDEEEDPDQRGLPNRGWGEWGENAPVESDFEEEEDLNQGSCVTCLDDLSDQDAHRSPCGHDWCRACIVNRFEMAARSTHMFPAQCCGQPILPDNHELIDIETWAQYFEKRTEVETRNPTYCSKRDCSQFIPLRDITEGQARCICGQVTCTSCKAESHPGECVTDPETEQVLALAREQQWQTCFHCRELVVRRDGCNEMECRCGHTFCYACGLEWKTCSCPQFGYQPDFAPGLPAGRPLDIMAQRLREPTLAVRPRNIIDLTRDDSDPRPVPANGWGSEPVERVEPVEVDNTGAPVEWLPPRAPGRWVPRHLRPHERVEPVEVDNTGAPVEWLPPRAPGRWVPRNLRPHGPVEPVEVGDTGAPAEETAVDGPTEGRPRRASPNNPGCRAHNWRRIGGEGTCQTCNAVMSNFRFQCRTCGHNSCVRCRRRADRAR